MKGIVLNEREIDVVIECLKERMKMGVKNDDSYIKTNSILTIFSSEDHHINPKDRSWVIGCIRDYYIEPSKELFKITDYDAVMANDNILKKMKEIDVALALINKLQKKSEKQEKLFHDKYSKLSGLGKLQKVLFSESSNGHLYKIGLFFTNGKGLKFDNETGQMQEINVDIVTLTDYEYEITADKFITKLKDRLKTVELSALELQILSIVEKYK